MKPRTTSHDKLYEKLSKAANKARKDFNIPEDLEPVMELKNGKYVFSNSCLQKGLEKTDKFKSPINIGCNPLNMSNEQTAYFLSFNPVFDMERDFGISVK